MLLPGTSCTWEINFNLLAEPLSQEYHVLCVNYTGFDGSDAVFDSQEVETERIPAFLILAPTKIPAKGNIANAFMFLGLALCMIW